MSPISLQQKFVDQYSFLTLNVISCMQSIAQLFSLAQRNAAVLMNPRQVRILRSFASKSVCRHCQVKFLHNTPRLRDPFQDENQPANSRPAPNRAIAPTRLRDGFTPEPLGAPIGLELRPQPGQDHFDLGSSAHERSLAYRRNLIKTFSKPYMRDFRNLDAHRGKFYIANDKLWREPSSYYFPNLRGSTLATGNEQDTTKVLRDKISLVAVWSRAWAMEQVKTFTEDKAIRAIIEESNGRAQLVDMTFEEQRLYALVMRLFQWNLKSSIPQEQWSKFFVLPGIPLDVKESLGIMNDKVGYVFLLDGNCKIRWSACGDAWGEEKTSLMRGLTKLIGEHKISR